MYTHFFTCAVQTGMTTKLLRGDTGTMWCMALTTLTLFRP